MRPRSRAARSRGSSDDRLRQRLELGVAEGGVVVEGDLGVEGVDPPVGREDQRVDLDEVGVELDERLVQLLEDRDGAAAGGRVEPGAEDELAGVVVLDADQRVDVDPGDGRRVLLRHLLDVDAALGAHHPEVLLGRPVEGEGGVVLLADVAGLLDPHRADDVALDVHAQDVGGVQAGLVGGVGQLDAAGLAPPADLHLGLDHDRIAEPVGGGDGVVDGLDGLAGGDGHAEARQQLLALVLEEVHVALAFNHSGRPHSLCRQPDAGEVSWPSWPSRSSSAPASQSTMACIGVPGVKMAATPCSLRVAMSSSGMIPPPKTSTSPTPLSFSWAMTLGNSVLWAPDRSDRPTASASSWITVSATCSAVWWRPV